MINKDESLADSIKLRVWIQTRKKYKYCFIKQLNKCWKCRYSLYFYYFLPSFCYRVEMKTNLKFWQNLILCNVFESFFGMKIYPHMIAHGIKERAEELGNLKSKISWKETLEFERFRHYVLKKKKSGKIGTQPHPIWPKNLHSLNT